MSAMQLDINENQLNYVILLATHMACIDGQLHRKEVEILNDLVDELGGSDETLKVMESIFSQSYDYFTSDYVTQKVEQSDRERALYIINYMALIDGYMDKAESDFIMRTRKAWGFDEFESNKIFSSAKTHVEASSQLDHSNTLLESHTDFKPSIGLDSLLKSHLFNTVVANIGTKALKEKINNYRNQSLLSGPEYDETISICRQIGEQDIEVADECLGVTQRSLIQLEEGLAKAIDTITKRAGNTPSDQIREVIKALQDDKKNLNEITVTELNNIIELQERKRRAIKYFTISFMGKSKAGKSTLHAIITGEGWEAIGVGKQNTTRLNRVYEWKNIRIIDTPGIAAPDGAEYQKIAETIIDESDVMCFVVTNNNQQKSEFEFLKQLKKKGKPLLVLMNVQENLTSEIRLRRFLEKPNEIFSDDKAKLGGHFDRIRRDAKEYYGTAEFPIIPVQLMAARLARQEIDQIKSNHLMKASRLQSFLGTCIK